MTADFIELGITSNFSFLRGASHGHELVLTALAQGYEAMGIADHNTLAGVVRVHAPAGKEGLRPLIGCRLDLLDAPSMLAYPTDRAAYGRLCELLSLGKRRAEKGACHLHLEDVAQHQSGLILVALPSADIAQQLPRMTDVLPSLTHLAASMLYRGDDVAQVTRLDRLARTYDMCLLGTNDVLYHTPQRRPLQDVMTCIREKTTLANAGYLLEANAERHLKSPEEMARLFARWPHALRASVEIAGAIDFSLDELRYEYPSEVVPEGKTAMQHLRDLTQVGAARRYPDGVPAKVAAQIEKELALIEKMEIPQYFLTVHDIVAFARALPSPILCQGRGSAANSAVCYCLGITAVDPATTSLLFERFISESRKEPPDIDVDFEHERREEVIQHIYKRYGRERAGLAATVIHYRPRMAIREVGKVMGLSEDVTAEIAKTAWGSWGSTLHLEQAKEAGLDLSDPHLKRAMRLADELIGMPRHLSQHVGGFILTQDRLTSTVPIGNAAMDDRTFIEWDKDDIEELGILKVDVLALGMLTCIAKAFDMLSHVYGVDYELATIPQDDQATYDMLCKGDSLGVFQVESRAQMAMLPRMKPRRFYDLVIEVAIVRPGPIQGDMVHPYLRRREGLEEVHYPSPAPEHGPRDELEKILRRTLGVPIFQEQAMQIAIDAAKFTGDEANQLRKAMATFRSRGQIDAHQDQMVKKMVARGYEEEFAMRCFAQIRGFGEYGFPESHAASFAHLVYVSSWIKCHYPDVFAASLLNSQPMGFYAPAQIVRDAREHGVDVLPVDVNISEWDNFLEPTQQKGRHGLRLGLRQVDGISEATAKTIEAACDMPFADMTDFHERTRLPVHLIEKLAAADAFRSMGLDRRQALWDVRRLKDAPDLPLFAHVEERPEGADPHTALPEMPLSEHVVADYQTLRLSLKAHPVQFLRSRFADRGAQPCKAIYGMKNGTRTAVAGVVLVRQRPGTAKGVVFVTIEDETGVANIIVWPKMLEKFRKVVMTSRLLFIKGQVQSANNVTHFVAYDIADCSAELDRLSHDDTEVHPQLSRADEVLRPIAHRPAHNTQSVGRTHPRNVRVIPKSRDFH
ncbi:MAG: error-prone DNA polymerase [Pseudomonadota bacterium]